MTVISPSHLAREALKADGVEHSAITTIKAAHDTLCVFCGCIIKKGDSCNPWKKTTTFNDVPMLKARHSNHACEDCSVVAMNLSEPAKVGLKLLQLGKFCIYNKKGTHRVIHKAALAHAIINPPEPPFVFCQGTSMNSEHIIWKAPVSLSKDYFFIQLLNQTFSIDRKRVIAGSESIKKLSELMVENGLKFKNSKAPCFISTDLEIKNTSFGQFRDDLLLLAVQNKDVAMHINSLNALKLGELWAAIIVTIFEPSDENIISLDINLKKKD